MKKIIKAFSVFMLFLPSFLFAQNGYLDNNPIWKMSSGCAMQMCSGPAPCIEYVDYNYYLNGDTVLNSHIYKKLFKKGFVYHTWSNNPPVPSCCQSSYFFNDTINPISLLRDTLNKIFIIDSLGNPETLLYDFNLSVGDSLPISYNNHDSSITVIAIDSVPISNYYRKRFQLLNSAWWTQYLIEGVGHDWGLLETMNPVLECGWNLLCYGLGDTSYYPTMGPTCNITVGIMEQDHFTSAISLYPNPFTNELTVTGEILQEIKIRDLYGRLIHAQKLKSPNCLLSTELWPLGIYFVEVRDENGNTTVKRVTKM